MALKTFKPYTKSVRGTVLVDKSEYVDIDDEFDFKMATCIMKDKIQHDLQEKN